MDFSLSNFIEVRKKSKIGDFQDLDHIDGVSISSVSCGLYNEKRDDLVLFYFRDKANYASVYTQSEVISENIKWNRKIKAKKISALLVNTRNANALTGNDGYKSLKLLSEDLSDRLGKMQINDEEKPQKINFNEIMFACTGTIGEKFPFDKISKNIPNLIDKLKHVQNKYIWMKAALAIMTTDTRPKVSMSECKIGSSTVKVYGIAKGSGMIFPNMATTLGFIFTDATLSSNVLKKILSKNIETTFNAISCDGDTSTNDMVSIFSTNKVDHQEIKNYKDPKLNNFDKSVNEVMLNLAKSVVSDGEGASKSITINCKNCRNEKEAKKISFSIANSPLFKTAIAGEDANWGRILMAVGKSGVKLNVKKISIKIGNLKVFTKGSIDKNFDEKQISDYMKNELIDLEIDMGLGKKGFKAYTMDLTQEYIKINADYRS